MDRKMYPLRKNTLFILNANTLHRDENGADGSIFRRYVLHILPSLLEQLSTPQTDFTEALKNSGACIRPVSYTHLSRSLTSTSSTRAITSRKRPVPAAHLSFI